VHDDTTDAPEKAGKETKEQLKERKGKGKEWQSVDTLDLGLIYCRRPLREKKSYRGTWVTRAGRKWAMRRNEGDHVIEP
jgi:hypothetical protein